MKKQYKLVALCFMSFVDNDVITTSALSDEQVETGLDAESKWWGQ